jgi:hypothetical protein
MLNTDQCSQDRRVMYVECTIKNYPWVDSGLLKFQV